MMTLDDDENTATFLIEKLEKLLEPLPIDIDNTTFAEALADDFEILFLMAQYGSEYWNSLEESFEEFCIRHSLNYHENKPSHYCILTNACQRLNAIPDKYEKKYRFRVI
ncbi:TPA: hypothetical protein ACLA7D_000133 [Neisseria meningitidis]